MNIPNVPCGTNHKAAQKRSALVIGIWLLLILSLLVALTACQGDPGEKGEDGAPGEKGEPGQDGRGVESAEINEEHRLILTLTDGTVMDLGNVKGDKGDPNVTITNIEMDYLGRVTITCSNGDIYNVPIVELSHVHTFDTDVVAPTCTEKGYTKYTCSDCGYSYSNDFVPASGHHFYNEVCVFCGEAEPFAEIEPDVSWFDASVSEFLLEDKYQLSGLSYLVNHGNNFSGKTVYLKNSLDLLSAEWVPIGSDTHPFAGTFDGRNLSINNLKINKQQSYLGLFGYVTGTVRNLEITGADVSVSEGIYSYIAIACGYSTTPINGVKVSGTVSAPGCNYVGGVAGRTRVASDSENHAKISGKDYVGGIAGYMNYSSTETFGNLKNSGEITGETYTGGIVGYYDNSRSESWVTYAVTISKVENSGKVHGGDYASGLFGRMYVYCGGNGSWARLTATELANTGDVEGKKYVGGLCGSAYSNTGDSSISASRSSCKVQGDSYVGGLAGELSNVQMLDCDNENSQIVATGYTPNGSVSDACVGGYVGAGFIVRNCVNRSEIVYESLGRFVGGVAGRTRVASDSENHAKISGKDYVGGIAGYMNYSAEETFGNLKNSGEITGESYTGGIAGYYDNSRSENWVTYAVTISKIENSGKVHGGDYAGGLFGRMYIYCGGNGSWARLTATELANTGDVEGKKYVGGLCGSAYSNTGDSSISASRSSCKVKGDSYVGGLAGELSNVQMLDCENENSQIVATAYSANGSVNDACVGGYVGAGFIVRNCVNRSEIVYESLGRFVGGVAGRARVVSDSENHAKISGKDCVGGIVGYMNYNTTETFGNLKNSGEITGESYTGGIAGYYENSRSESWVTYAVTISKVENSGKIHGGDYAGGLFGRIYVYCGGNGSWARLTATELANTGDVEGKKYVGGLCGSAYSNTGDSSISASRSSCKVKGDSYVGGLAGELSTVQMLDCENENSQIVATGYTPNGSVSDACVGGYVGAGFIVRNCVNRSEIVYESLGRFVGGVAGRARVVSDSENHAKISGKDYVGGIVGYMNYNTTETFGNLKNSGEITGETYIGGIAGYYENSRSENWASFIVTISKVENSGKVRGGDYVGGLFGKTYIYCGGNGSWARLTTTELANTGDVEGKKYVGGLFGEVYTNNGDSGVEAYSNTGTVTGEENADEYFGAATNFKLIATE